MESYAALKSLSTCPDNRNAACDFSGKAIIIGCNGNTLDANRAGRFFRGEGSGSSLQVHGCTLMNGKAEYVSAFLSTISVQERNLMTFPVCRGTAHTTQF